MIARQEELDDRATVHELIRTADLGEASAINDAPTMVVLEKLRQRLAGQIRTAYSRLYRRSGGDEDGFEQRSQAARDILTRHRRARRPFVLFLRTFDIQFVLGSPRYPGDPGGVYFLRDRINKRLKRGVGLVAIAQQGELPFMRSTKASAVPLLWLENENWEPVVDHLIGAASIILTEVTHLTPGVVRELELIRHHAKEDETIVVLPGPDMPFDLSELSPPLSDFPRVVRISELPAKNPLRSFVFADLVTRIYEIARASDYERLAADLNGEWRRRFPVTFDGVVEGYDRLGKFYLPRRVLGLALARFQKALTAAKARHDLRGIAEQYVNLARVMYAAGDPTASRSWLEQARSAFDEVGHKFDVAAMESELAMSLIKEVMTHSLMTGIDDELYRRE